MQSVLNEHLESWRDDERRRVWHESGAYDQFSDVEMQFPEGFRDRARVGALLIQGMQGLDGLHCWLAPIEGFPKLLSPKSSVRVFTRDAMPVFAGAWADAPLDFVARELEFFIWLAGREGADSPPTDWRTKLIGAWRWLKFKMRGKRK